MKWVDAAGVSLRCDTRGAGRGTVVFVHEAGGSLESWDEVAQRLPAAWPAVRYDQRGFGQSEKTGELTLEGMVRDLVGLLDALDVDGPCHLVGTAIGGSIALACAAAHPDRVASVVASSPVTGPLPGAALASLAQRATLVESQGMRAVADTSLQRSYPPELRTDRQRFEQYRNRYLANDPRSFAALTRAFGTVDLTGLHGRIRCPALIVGCTRDGLKPARECAELAARIAGGRFVEVDSGHFVAVQTPELFAPLLREFIQECHDQP
jgi:3-oxoadipate enol-lactonase